MKNLFLKNIEYIPYISISFLSLLISFFSLCRDPAHPVVESPEIDMMEAAAAGEEAKKRNERTR